MPIYIDKFGHKVGVPDELIPEDIKERLATLPLIKGPPGRRLRLFECTNDGHIEYCLEGMDMGPAWIPVNKSSGTYIPLAAREWLKLKFANDWIGTAAGKTVVIMGAGPQMKRLSHDLAAHLSARKDVVLVGVNAVPAIFDRMAKVPSAEALDWIVAADAVFKGVYPLWGWDKLGDVYRFIKSRYYDANTFPIYSTHAPGLNPTATAGRDSITHAINLALLAQATEMTAEQHKAGPDKSWPIRYMRRAEGARIILLGVEHNKYNHAYTDNADFYLSDVPDMDWPDFDSKAKSHRQMQDFARELGAEVVNGAPWSAIDAHPFVDAEEYLSIPESIRTGLSKDGPPEVGERPHDTEKMARYHRACIAAGHAGTAPPSPPQKGA